MKKRQFKQKLKLTKVVVTDLNSVVGGIAAAGTHYEWCENGRAAAGTHYEWCENGGSNFPCEIRE